MFQSKQPEDMAFVKGFMVNHMDACKKEKYCICKDMYHEFEVRLFKHYLKNEFSEL